MIKASEEYNNAQVNDFDEARYGQLSELASELPELGGTGGLLPIESVAHWQRRPL